MDSHFRPHASVLILLLLVTGPAHSAVPDPAQSQADPVLIGNSSGSPIGNGFTAIVRDVNGAPLAGDIVMLKFLNATSRPYDMQNAGVTVDCDHLELSQVTGVDGKVAFHPRLGGFDNDRNVEVRANGILLAIIPARSTDLNGDGTTDGQDETLFEQNFTQNPAAPETDYNDDGVTDALDRAIFQEELRIVSVGTPCVGLMLPKFVSITATDVKDPKPGSTVQEEIQTLFGGSWNLDLSIALGNISKVMIQIQEGCGPAGRIVYEAQFTKRDLKSAGQLSMTTPYISQGTHCVSLFVQGSRGASATLEVRLP